MIFGEDGLTILKSPIDFPKMYTLNRTRVETMI